MQHIYKEVAAFMTFITGPKWSSDDQGGIAVTQLKKESNFIKIFYWLSDCDENGMKMEVRLYKLFVLKF